MSKVTREEVDRISQLAKLEIDAQDLNQFVSEFEEILQLFSQLQELETTSVASFQHGDETPMRKDLVRNSLEQKGALSNAPDPEQGQFRVPGVIRK